MRWIGAILAVLILVFAFTCPSQLGGGPSKIVILISIDGLRPDALSAENSPNIWRLVENGSFYSNAQTIPLSITYPAHTSMLTGLRATKHKIFSNPVEKPFKSQFVKCKTVFHYTKKWDVTNIFVASCWYFLGFTPANPYIDTFLVEGRSWDIKWTTEKTIKALRKYQNSNEIFTFTYYGETDNMGHKYGWMSEEYLEALRVIDGEIGKLVSFLKERKYYDRTYFIISADHGGKHKYHLAGRKEDRTIPIVIKGPNVKSGFKTTEKAGILDITPTILYIFGAKDNIFKNFDGKVLKGVFK
jgi:predicted AlkP superfamily pyrophosphatase or phosphodiesterase